MHVCFLPIVQRKFTSEKKLLIIIKCIIPSMPFHDTDSMRIIYTHMKIREYQKCRTANLRKSRQTVFVFVIVLVFSIHVRLTGMNEWRVWKRGFYRSDKAYRIVSINSKMLFNTRSQKLTEGEFAKWFITYEFNSRNMAHTICILQIDSTSEILTLLSREKNPFLGLLIVCHEFILSENASSM